MNVLSKLVADHRCEHVTGTSRDKADFQLPEQTE
jgi:hypothetical protein